jgi:hypothetical protein
MRCRRDGRPAALAGERNLPVIGLDVVPEVIRQPRDTLLDQSRRCTRRSSRPPSMRTRREPSREHAAAPGSLMHWRKELPAVRAAEQSNPQSSWGMRGRIRLRGASAVTGRHPPGPMTDRGDLRLDQHAPPLINFVETLSLARSSRQQFECPGLLGFRLARF